MLPERCKYREAHFISTALSREAWAKLGEWAILAGKGRLLLSGSIVLASLKAAVNIAQIEDILS